MTLKEMKVKSLALIEELEAFRDEDNKLVIDGKLTSDEDIATKLNEVVNQVMYEVCRIKKLPKYIEVPVAEGEVLDYPRFEKECGYEVYQVGLISGVSYTPRANGTLFKMLESGTAEIDLFVYPERITAKTSDSYEFELTADVLELMPYGIAADLLSVDVSNNYGKIFRERYEGMLNRLDIRNQMSSISVEGGFRF
jgi:hypothetical protein